MRVNMGARQMPTMMARKKGDMPVDMAFRQLVSQMMIRVRSSKVFISFSNSAIKSVYNTRATTLKSPSTPTPITQYIVSSVLPKFSAVYTAIQSTQS